MEGLNNIVVLIDADNTQLPKLDAVIREISTHGRIVVKRAYGNWKKESLKNWETELNRLAIKAEQQFDYVTGKNATDMIPPASLTKVMTLFLALDAVQVKIGIIAGIKGCQREIRRSRCRTHG